MDIVKPYYYFNYLIGLSPFEIDGIPKKDLVSWTIQNFPTVGFLLCYLLTLASVLWENDTDSEIGMAVNCIQFLPNAFAYISILLMSFKRKDQMRTIILLCDSMRCKLKQISKENTYLDKQMVKVSYFLIYSNN